MPKGLIRVKNRAEGWRFSSVVKIYHSLCPELVPSREREIDRQTHGDKEKGRGVRGGRKRKRKRKIERKEKEKEREERETWGGRGDTKTHI